MKRILPLVIIIVLFSSCRLFNTHHNPFVEDFPNRIGDSWTYKYTEGNGSQHDIEVKIVGQGKLPNGQIAKIWQYKYPGFTDSVWVMSNDTEAIFYNKPCCTTMPLQRLRLVFPLNVGNSWHTDAPYGDTTRVWNQSTISVPAGTFQNVYGISKTVGYVTNSWTKDTLWYKNKIGIVRKSQSEFSLGPLPGNGTWELRSYIVN